MSASRENQSTLQDSQNTLFILGAGSLGLLFCHFITKAIGKPNSKFSKAVLLTKKTSKQSIETIYYSNQRDPRLNTHFEIECKTLSELNQPIKYLLITTKTHDCLNFLDTQKHLIDSNAYIYFVQNGMGIYDYLDHNRVTWRAFQISVTEGANRPNQSLNDDVGDNPITKPKETYSVTHAGSGLNTIAPLNAAAFKSLDDDNMDFWLSLDIEIEINETILPILIAKLAVNCGINGLTALYEVPNGKLVEDKILQARVKLLCEEFDQVASHYDWPIKLPTLGHVNKIALQTRENYSSTYQDFQLGKTSELAYMNGYLIQKAKLANIETPTHSTLMSELQRISADAAKS